ncbi:MAG: permease [Acidimicrobiia bacterium]|nr:permease [Acidimicrobiia bacterium]
MEQVLDLFGRVLGDVAGTFGRVWPFLAISVIAAAVVSVYVGTDRVSALLKRRSSVATGGAVLLATLTPFCSCGTTAVLLGMLATAAPWAPLVAFMVASPLTSPSELVFSAGLFGWPFALIFFVGTIVLGLAAGGVAAALDRTGWLTGQARLDSDSSCATGACSVPQPVAASIGPGTASIAEFPSLRRRWKIDEFATELMSVGRKLLLFFLGFTAVGYLAIEAIPTAWLTEYLGEGSAFAVPLAAVLGIPAYINTEASLPLVAALMDGGMGPGPAMAFLVTGAGTSIGAISGLFVIARKRVVGLVVALLFVGAMVMGIVAQMVLG